MKHRARALRIGVRLAFGCASAAAAAGYAQWEKVPEITLEAESNDNPALDVDETDVITGLDQASRLLADVLVRFRKTEPRGQLTFEPRVRRDVYADEEARDLESTDAFLRSSGEYRGQTVRLGYNLDLARERLLGVEFLETLDPIVDNPTDIATNQVGANERRTSVGVGPYVDITLSGRGGILLDGHIVDVDYARGATDGRTDFVERGLGGEYRRELGDERARFGVRVFATGYKAALNNNTTDTRGLELRYLRTVTELWSWNIRGGTQHSDFVLSSAGRRVRGSDSTPVFGFGIDKRGEQSQMSAEYAWEMSPDSLGFVAPRHELRLAWQRTLSERVTGGLAIRAIDAEGRPEVAGSARQYGVAELDMEWQVRPLWWFIAGYTYSTARASGSDSAASNSLGIGVRYRGRSGQGAPRPIRQQSPTQQPRTQPSQQPQQQPQQPQQQTQPPGSQPATPPSR